MTLLETFYSVSFHLAVEAQKAGRRVCVQRSSFEDFEGLAHCELDQAIEGRPPAFIWSDTPFLGVGNSCDTDPLRVEEWAHSYDGTDMELAYIDQLQKKIYYLYIE